MTILDFVVIELVQPNRIAVDFNPAATTKIAALDVVADDRRAAVAVWWGPTDFDVILVSVSVSFDFASFFVDVGHFQRSFCSSCIVLLLKMLEESKSSSCS